MRKTLLLFALLAVALPHLIASPENDAIIAATKTYVAANSAGMTKINVTVEKVESDFARVKVTPQEAGTADPAWAFLKKKAGKWSGLTLGTAFGPEDYQELGIPKSLQIR